jgi:hypothetical protein
MPAYTIIDARVNDQRSGVCDPYDATVLVEIGRELSEPHRVHELVLEAVEQGDREVTVYSSATKGAIWLEADPVYDSGLLEAARELGFVNVISVDS